MAENEEKYALVGKCAECCRRVTRLIRTRVHVAVDFRQQVYIVEEVALVIASFVCLREANVEQHAAIEMACGCLNEPIPAILHSYNTVIVAFSALRCWLGVKNSIRPLKIE